MDPNSQRPKGRDRIFSSLDVAIEALNIANDASGIPPARAVFGSVSALLTMIRDAMANQTGYIELGLYCADVCAALERGMGGKKLGDLSQCVREAIEQLTTTVAEIQEKITKKRKRNILSRLFHSKNDKDAIAAWMQDLGRILQVFNTELAMNTHVTVYEIRNDVSKIREEIGGQAHSVQISTSGESPPPPPRACFGRDELIEKIIGLTEDLAPTALIGPGGIGKTSIALTVLHHHRIKKRFGDYRRFIRCDQFLASHTHLLSRLSKVVGAGIENPEDITPLRPSLSSREMIIILDNAESILDPRGVNAKEIYAIMEELSQFDNICLCITSRLSTIPSACEALDIPTLSTEAARDTFYRIYKNRGQSDLVDGILERLDFHPLSITLLATVGHHNKWDPDRLSREWESQRTDVLHTHHGTSLAATIELSLASPMFQKLGPDARGLLEVAAFFPQGIDEKNLDWLFPTVPDRTNIFDHFCMLSLAYRSDGFVTMLAPLRDHLSPKDPTSSPLLQTTKDCYFSRLSVDVEPGKPGYEGARWIISEDVNTEHLLDILTSIEDSVEVWGACENFIQHLYWHKPRLVMLGPKIEGLPDGHHSKPSCLFELSQLFDRVGNCAEAKQLLVHTLNLWRERRNDLRVAGTLRSISSADRWLGLCEDGIRRIKEALAIYEQLNDVLGQAHSWRILAWLLYGDNQFDAAEEAASKALDLFSDKQDEYEVCQCHRLLGKICGSRGEVEKAIEHFETALKIASSFGWCDLLFWINFSLAEMFLRENRFGDTHVHLERAKSHTINYPYLLARAMDLEAAVWYKEGRFEEARSEALRALDALEKFGAAQDAARCRTNLRVIEEELTDPAASLE